MHELALDFVQDAGAQGALTQLGLDDGAMLAWFDAGAAPRWVAKIAATDTGCRRLRHEAQALGWLEPYAGSLQLPRLLGWSDREGECCLVQSGVAGEPLSGLSKWRQGRVLPAVLGWLRRFQHCVPSPRAPSLVELEQELRHEMVRQPDAEGLDVRLARAWGECPQAAAPVPVHGDFWCGNVLWAQPGGVGVVDWSGFDAGTALEDLLTWFGAGAGGDWVASLFQPGRTRATVREWAAAAGYSDAMGRYAFYWHCLRRLRWELGLCRQTRSARERSESGTRWRVRIEWLEAQGWPDPFAPGIPDHGRH